MNLDSTNTALNVNAFFTLIKSLPSTNPEVKELMSKISDYNLILARKNLEIKNKTIIWKNYTLNLEKKIKSSITFSGHLIE